jgi:hypothetical protein
VAGVYPYQFEVVTLDRRNNDETKITTFPLVFYRGHPFAGRMELVPWYSLLVRHFIQYHNPQRYGPPGEHRPGEPFWIATNKNPRWLPGNAVWVVMGEGTPRVYTLFAVFAAGWVERTSDVDFLYHAGGLDGLRFDPEIELNPFPWFQEMKRSLGNFSLGLTEITHTYAPRLIALARGNSPAYLQAEARGWFQDPSAG